MKANVKISLKQQNITSSRVPAFLALNLDFTIAYMFQDVSVLTQLPYKLKIQSSRVPATRYYM